MTNNEAVAGRAAYEHERNNETVVDSQGRICKSRIERTLEQEADELDDLFCKWESGGSGPRETLVADLVRRAHAAGIPPAITADLVRGDR